LAPNGASSATLMPSAPAARLVTSVVPGPVPSLIHSSLPFTPSFAAKNKRPPATVKWLGELPPPAEVRTLATSTVPAVVPSVRQSSLPLLPSLAAK
jgi:hypothetical protein